MEYTLFQDFAPNIPRPAPPTGRQGPAQSGRTPEFGYEWNRKDMFISLKSDLRQFFNIAGKGQKIDFAYNLWGERPLGAHKQNKQI